MSVPPVPSAPSPSKPWYTRWWAIAAAVVLVVACLGAVVGDDRSADGDDTTNTRADDGDAPGTPENGDADQPDEPEEPDYFTSEWPVFDAVTETGSGDSVVELPAAKGMLIATHSGSSNFVIETLGADNDGTGLVVNAIGKYEGTTIYGEREFRGESTALQISADGAWEITIAPVIDAPEFTDAQEGTGDGVYRYTGDAARWTLTHDGDSNFAVHYFTDARFGSDLLINEIGRYDGTVAVSTGPAVVVITADGGWSITN